MRAQLHEPSTHPAQALMGLRDGPAALPAADLRDDAAFESFYRARWEQVVNFARFRLGESEAEDVAADVFVRAWADRSRFDGRRGPPEAWLLGIARHVVVDRLRRGRRTDGLDPAVGAPDEGLAAAEGRLDLRTVRSAMAGLPLLDQEILSLRFGAGLDHRSIAAALGQREGNIALRLHRCLRRLRAVLQGEGHEYRA